VASSDDSFNDVPDYYSYEDSFESDEIPVTVKQSQLLLRGW